MPNLDPNELLAELDRIAVRTEAGSFVKVDDVKRLVQARREAVVEDAQARVERGPIRTVEQARAAARRDPEIMQHFPSTVMEPGRSIPATDGQPSAVESVKRS